MIGTLLAWFMSVWVLVSAIRFAMDLFRASWTG